MPKLDNVAKVIILAVALALLLITASVARVEATMLNIKASEQLICFKPLSIHGPTDG